LRCRYVERSGARTQGFAAFVQWSPDGKTIIYTRDADQGNIFTIDNYK
jgi:Tol biopolymer transport system component